MPVVINGTTGISGVDGSAGTPSYQGGDTNTGIFYPAADTIAFAEGGAEIARFDSSGNFGIGITPAANTRITLRTATTTDAAIVADNTLNSGFKVQFASNLTTILNDFNNPLALGTNNTERMRITSGGIVLAGTSTTPAGNSIQMVLSNSNGGGIQLNNSTSSAGGVINATGGSGLVFFSYTGAIGSESYTERMRIASGGEVLVGTTATWFGRGMVIENGSDALGCINDAATAYPLSVQNTATSGNNIFVGFWTEGRGLPTSRGTIDYNRGAGQVRYNTTSDATLKNIIGDSDGQKSVDILKSTKIREFAWKNDAEQKPQVGVIAQELYETYKGAVSVGGEFEKTDNEGNVTKEYKPWGVDKTAFTFHLIAGWQAHEKIIQEQQAMIEELKQEVAALKAK